MFAGPALGEEIPQPAPAAGAGALAVGVTAAGAERSVPFLPYDIPSVSGASRSALISKPYILKA